MSGIINRCGESIQVGQMYQYGEYVEVKGSRCEVANLEHHVMTDQLIEFPLDWVVVQSVTKGVDQDRKGRDLYYAVIEFSDGRTEKVLTDKLVPVDLIARGTHQSCESYTSRINS